MLWKPQHRVVTRAQAEILRRANRKGMGRGVRVVEYSFAAAVLTFAAVFALPGRAVASPVEFCPAKVSDFAPAGGDTYAFQLSALTPRRITGSLAIESERGWYRAVFKPQPIGIVYVRFPQHVNVINAWVATAASDDPGWAQHGIVTCPPHPRPDLKREKPLPLPVSVAIVAAQMTKPLASTACRTPFAEARVTTQGKPADGAPGYSVAIRIDLDANGRPVGKTVMDVSPSSAIEYGKAALDEIATMRFAPAIAYCQPVPSTYILRQTVNP
jgi:hypothetical protein